MKKTLLTLIILLTAIPALHAQDVLTRVIVANEGNFTQGNATLTEFVVDNNTATDGVFFDANGFPLGDIAQSLNIFDGKLYVVINNSRVIRVLDPETFQQRFEITIGGNASPREIIRLNSKYAYVTNLFDDSVSLIDLELNREILPRIPVGQDPDGAFFHEGLAYISNNGFGADSTVFVLDPKLDEGTTGDISTHEVIDTLFVSRGPAGMTLDDQNRLWIVSTGFDGEFDENFNIIPGTGRPGGVHVFDIDTHQELAFFQIESAGSDIAFNPVENEIYINSGGILAINTETLTIEPQPRIEGNFFTFGLSSGESVPRLYLADAKDFTVRGEAFIHETDGTFVNSFDTGIIPGDFLFIFDSTVTSNETTDPDIPQKAKLNQNFPNPFNPSTVITFELPAATDVQLKVYDITGREVMTLVNGIRAAGTHEVRLDGSGLASGMYFYRLRAENITLTRKLTLIK